MLEKITNTFSNIVRTVSGKSVITEKNIEETVDQIKMALLEADVNLGLSAALSMPLWKRPRVKKSCGLWIRGSSS